MDNSTFWWQGAGVDPGPGPGPDGGDPIGQSLRFRGAQLSRSMGASTVWTLSFWVKKGRIGSEVRLFQSSSKSVALKYSSADELFYEQSVTSGKTLEKYRDPSAWYHVVYNYGDGGDVVKLWVNGETVNPNMSAGGNSLGGTVTIGESGGTQDYYMAAVYLIDGQALDPTAFGRFSAQGVWVPVDAQGLTYGTNGFKLTFEDPSNIGKDYSGNGNDFTATGFDTAGNSTRDGTVYTETGVEQQQAFDNSILVGAIPVTPSASQNATNFMTTIELPKLVNSISVDFGYTNTANCASNFLVSADGSQNSWTAYAYGTSVPFPITISNPTPFKYIRWVVTTDTWNWPSTAGISPGVSTTYDLMRTRRRRTMRR